MQKKVDKKIREKKLYVRARYFFLTIPRIDESLLSKNLIEGLLLEKENDLSQYVISIEKHQNVRTKGLHLHIWLRFRKAKEFGLKHFDYLGKHGKLENVRSSDNVLKYISKEDPQPLANFDLQRYNLKKSFEEGVLSLYKQGWSFSKIMFTFPDVVSKKKWMSMKQFLIQYEEISLETHYRKTLTGIRYISRELIEKLLNEDEIKLFDSFYGYQDLIDIINKTIHQKYNQKHKDCCLSLVGNPSIGKTYIFQVLEKYCPIYRYPEDGWHRDYTNNLYSAIVWHEWEYSLHSPETYLRLFEGIPTDLRIKGSKGIKSDRPYIFLTSNIKWTDKVLKRFKRNKFDLEVNLKALSVRIKEIDFGDRNLTFLTKLFIGCSEDINPSS